MANAILKKKKMDLVGPAPLKDTSEVSRIKCRHLFSGYTHLRYKGAGLLYEGQRCKYM